MESYQLWEKATHFGDQKKQSYDLIFMLQHEDLNGIFFTVSSKEDCTYSEAAAILMQKNVYQVSIALTLVSN